MTALYSTILFAAGSGFLLASYIRRKKVHQHSLVCPLRFHCDTVIRSKYSSLFGIPVELLGMAYYGMIAVTYLVFLAVPPLATSGTAIAVLIATVTAFLFSLYLTGVQAFVLRQWCTWCLISALFCTVIFVAALSLSDAVQTLFKISQ